MAVTFFNEMVARGCGLNGLTRNSQGGSMKKRAGFLAAGLSSLWAGCGFFHAPPPFLAAARFPRVFPPPASPLSIIRETAAINAAGRIASAAIIGSHHNRVYYYPQHHGRRW